MPRFVRKFERGFVDPLSLFGLLFLVVTLGVLTYVTANPNIRQLIGSSAKFVENGVSLSSKKNSDTAVVNVKNNKKGKNEDNQDSNPAPVATPVAPNTATTPSTDTPASSSSTNPQVGEFGYVYPNGDIAGTYLAPNGKRYLVATAGTAAAAFEYYKANPDKIVEANFSDTTKKELNLDAILEASKPPPPPTSADVKLGKIECTEAGGTFDDVSKTCLSKGTATAGTIKPPAPLTAQDKKIASQDCASAGGTYYSTYNSCIKTSSTQTVKETNEGLTTFTTTSYIDVNTGKVIQKIDSSAPTADASNRGSYNPLKKAEGEACNFASDCGSGKCERQGASYINRCVPSEDKPLVVQAINFLDAITFDKFSAYGNAYVSDYQVWQEQGFSSSDEYVRDCVSKTNTANAYNCFRQGTALSKKAAIATIDLGTTVTAEGAVIAALPAAAAAGSGGALFTTALTTYSGISTLQQTSSALVAQIEDPGFFREDIAVNSFLEAIDPKTYLTDAGNQTAMAALSWANLGTADKLVRTFGALETAAKAGQATEALVSAAQSARNLNNAVSLINLGIDLPNAINTCGQEGFLTRSCGSAAGAAVLDLVFGGLDYHQGQLGFGDPLAKIKAPLGPIYGPVQDVPDPNETRIASPAQLEQINQLQPNVGGDTLTFSNIGGETKFTPSTQLDMFDMLSGAPTANASTIVGNANQLLFPETQPSRDPKADFGLGQPDPNQTKLVAQFDIDAISKDKSTIGQLLPSDLDNQIPTTPEKGVETPFTASNPNPAKPAAELTIPVIDDALIKKIADKLPNDGASPQYLVDKLKAEGIPEDNITAADLDKINQLAKDRPLNVPDFAKPKAPDTNIAEPIKAPQNNLANLPTIPNDKPTSATTWLKEKVTDPLFGFLTGNPLPKTLDTASIAKPKPLLERLFGEANIIKINENTTRTLTLKPGDTIQFPGRDPFKIPNPEEYPNLYWRDQNLANSVPQKLTADGITFDVTSSKGAVLEIGPLDPKNPNWIDFGDNKDLSIKLFGKENASPVVPIKGPDGTATIARINPEPGVLSLSGITKAWDDNVVKPLGNLLFGNPLPKSLDTATNSDLKDAGVFFPSPEEIKTAKNESEEIIKDPVFQRIKDRAQKLKLANESGISALTPEEIAQSRIRNDYASQVLDEMTAKQRTFAKVSRDARGTGVYPRLQYDKLSQVVMSLPNESASFTFENILNKANSFDYKGADLNDLKTFINDINGGTSTRREIIDFVLDSEINPNIVSNVKTLNPIPEIQPNNSGQNSIFESVWSSVKKFFASPISEKGGAINANKLAESSANAISKTNPTALTKIQDWYSANIRDEQGLFPGLRTKVPVVEIPKIEVAPEVETIVNRAEDALVAGGHSKDIGCRTGICTTTSSLVTEDAARSGLGSVTYNVATLNYARGIDPSDSLFHDFSILTDSKGNNYIVDLTLNQFKDIDVNNPVAKTLLEKGVVPLTESNLNAYLDLAAKVSKPPVNLDILNKVNANLNTLDRAEVQDYFNNHYIGGTDLKPVAEDDVFARAYETLIAKGYTSDDAYELIGESMFNGESGRIANDAPPAKVDPSTNHIKIEAPNPPPLSKPKPTLFGIEWNGIRDENGKLQFPIDLGIKFNNFKNSDGKFTLWPFEKPTNLTGKTPVSTKTKDTFNNIIDYPQYLTDRKEILKRLSEDLSPEEFTTYKPLISDLIKSGLRDQISSPQDIRAIIDTLAEHSKNVDVILNYSPKLRDAGLLKSSFFGDKLLSLPPADLVKSLDINIKTAVALAPLKKSSYFNYIVAAATENPEKIQTILEYFPKIKDVNLDESVIFNTSYLSDKNDDLIKYLNNNIEVANKLAPIKDVPDFTYIVRYVSYSSPKNKDLIINLLPEIVGKHPDISDVYNFITSLNFAPTDLAHKLANNYIPTLLKNGEDLKSITSFSNFLKSRPEEVEITQIIDLIPSNQWVPLVKNYNIYDSQINLLDRFNAITTTAGKDQKIVINNFVAELQKIDTEYKITISQLLDGINPTSVNRYVYIDDYLQSIDNSYAESFAALAEKFDIKDWKTKSHAEVLAEISVKIPTVPIKPAKVSFDFQMQDVLYSAPENLMTTLRTGLESTQNAKANDIEVAIKKISDQYTKISDDILNKLVENGVNSAEKTQILSIVANTNRATAVTKIDGILKSNLPKTTKIQNIRNVVLASIKIPNQDIGLVIKELFTRTGNESLLNNFVKNRLSPEDTSIFLNQLTEIQTTGLPDLVQEHPGLSGFDKTLESTDVWKNIKQINAQKVVAEQVAQKYTKEITLSLTNKNIIDIWQGKVSGTCFGDCPAFLSQRSNIIPIKMLKDGDIFGNALFIVQPNKLILIGFDPSISFASAVTSAKMEEFVDLAMKGFQNIADKNGLELMIGIPGEVGGLSNREFVGDYIEKKYTKGSTIVPIQPESKLQPVHGYEPQNAYQLNDSVTSDLRKLEQQNTESVVNINSDTMDNTNPINTPPQKPKPTIFGFEYNGFKNEEGNFTLWPFEKTITKPNNINGNISPEQANTIKSLINTPNAEVTIDTVNGVVTRNPKPRSEIQSFDSTNYDKYLDFEFMRPKEFYKTYGGQNGIPKYLGDTPEGGFKLTYVPGAPISEFKGTLTIQEIDTAINKLKLQMENTGYAHGDLNSTNILIDTLPDGSHEINFVDYTGNTKSQTEKDFDLEILKENLDKHLRNKTNVTTEQSQSKPFIEYNKGTSPLRDNVVTINLNNKSYDFSFKPLKTSDYRNLVIKGVLVAGSLDFLAETFDYNIIPGFSIEQIYNSIVAQIEKSPTISGFLGNKTLPSTTNDSPTVEAPVTEPAAPVITKTNDQLLQEKILGVTEEMKATTPEELAKLYESIRDGSYKDPAYICGPLSAEILRRMGLYTADINELYTFEPGIQDKNGVWSKDGYILKTIFPESKFTTVNTLAQNQSIGDMEYWKSHPLKVGDFMFMETRGGSKGFDHMLVVDKVDAQGRAYSTTNHFTIVNGVTTFVVDRVLLYDPTNPNNPDAMFNKWTDRSLLNFNGNTGNGGFLIISPKPETIAVSINGGLNISNNQQVSIPKTEINEPQNYITKNSNGSILFSNNYSQLPTGTYSTHLKPPSNIVLHWDGNPADPNLHPEKLSIYTTYNGLEGRGASVHFAVGTDGVLQFLPMYEDKISLANGNSGITDTINIEFSGQNFDKKLPPQVEIDNAVKLIAKLVKQYNLPVDQITHHANQSDVNPEFLEMIKSLVKEELAKNP